ncbi:MAG: CXXX repeat peptide maturase [Bacteroidaceae bacterium]|nr:CXXX repeat peptide maturase [Bacteroidaceae bacterium]
MLKYLVILLDDTSTTYCHYENEKGERKLIALEDLKEGIFFAMKENLMIQFVYPDYELPQEYKDAIRTIDHSKIVPFGSEEKGDVVVLNGWTDFEECVFGEGTAYVLRTGKDEFFKKHLLIRDALGKIFRLNVVLTDVDAFTDTDFDTYKQCMQSLAEGIERLYVSGKAPQLNLLTDRMMLTAMNNCNAGWENITLAPDGKFYVCPAFYQADSGTINEEKAHSIGDLQHGVNIKNPQLYRLSYAPLCRNCDAYQCKRCVWLNRKTTLEVNTPGHEQCVTAHLERNASRELLANIRRHGVFMPEIEINEITYLDPFDVRKEW